MRIRAGLVYQIVNDLVDTTIYKEIIYWSGWAEQNRFIYDMYYIKIILESDIDYDPPFDFSIADYYQEEKILELFKNHPKDKIITAVSYYICHHQFIMASEISQIEVQNPVTRWFGTIGKNMEDVITFVLEQIYGFAINQISMKDYKIPGYDITIAGRSDGLVASSPGGIYNDHIIEYKFIKHRCNIDKVKSQIACYYKIYDKPVLLVVSDGKILKLYKYNIRNLEKIWNGLEPSLVRKCCELTKKLRPTILDMPEFVKLMQ